MTTMSDLPDDLAEEILSRVPLTSLSAVRTTCKKWYALSKDGIFGKSASGRKPFLGFMMKDYRVCSMKFDFVDPCIKQVSLLDQVEISQVFHCDGLLLCVSKDKSRLLVWNPYLGQTTWIQPRNNFHRLDRFAIGYDQNRNHKIVRIFGDHKTIDKLGNNPYLVFGYEIYDLSSNSWKVFSINPDWHIDFYQRGVSLKGNTYFLAEKIVIRKSGRTIKNEFIISFNFTTERFGQRLPLPFDSHNGDKFMSICCVREEQLAVLHQGWVTGHTLEIWVTNKIDPGAVLWSKFLRSISGSCKVQYTDGSFFIDEEKKVVVVVNLDGGLETGCNQTANIIGQDGYFKSVNMGEAPNLGKIGISGDMLPKFCCPLVCSYVPSLVQLQPGIISKESDD
ncbi:F-box/kelch-repeat protein [Cardamine amara subsp. amara]|uniref:F-box/kelch-repeat protein n=1 Tax=Cardamine amara subsp. amara TaxID=228776 RepID=A0ABD1AF52_CARAN